jgi:HEAT repeat protein
MGKKWRIIRFLLLGICLALFAWVVLRAREPVYQGRTLSVWLEKAKESEADSIERDNPAAVNAIRQIGANALPQLLGMVATRDTKLRVFLLNLQTEHPGIPLHLRKTEDCQEMAGCGFYILGSTAKPAVPALIKLLSDDDPEVRYWAAGCLGLIGPSAREAVPALLAGFNTNRYFWAVSFALGKIGPDARQAIPFLKGIASTNFMAQVALIQIGADSLTPFIDQLKDTSNRTKWNYAACVVGKFPTNTESAIPLLIAGLSKTNTAMLDCALAALGDIHQRADLCVPATIPFLQSTNGFIKGQALTVLRKFGPQSGAAVPEIIRCLADTDDFVRQGATNALRAIDAQAAAKAGVK